VEQIHNQIRYYTDMARAYRIALGLDGDAGGIERLGETITPVYNGWAEDQLPEFFYLRRERLSFGDLSLGALAGNYSIVGIRNPTASGLLIVVTDVFCDATGALQTIFCTYRPNGTVDHENSGQSRDTRWPGATTIPGARLVDRQQVAALTPVLMHINATANVQSVKHPCPFILHPGWELLFYPSAVNTALTMNFKWRERPFLPGELAG
jgi:hypothetical protein